MTTRLAVMDQIQDDLQNNLIASHGYKHTPVEVKRGIYKWDDFALKPVICYSLVADVADADNAYGEDARWLNFFFYIYAQTDGTGNTDQIFEMIDDLETFLQETTHFTYSKQTLIGDAEILEGGVSSPVNTALLEIRILYES